MISNKPEIGMGATIQHWSDRTACTVIRVYYNGKRVLLQKDLAKRIDANGMSESQQYDYTPDSNGSTYLATLRKDGRYRLKGGTSPVSFGFRNEYYDFSF